MNRITARIATLLIVGELLLVMASWLLSATMGGAVRSLLSTEGVRWLLGSFADMLQTPLLIWLLLLAMAYGCMLGSGCLNRHNSRKHYRRVLTPLRGALLLVLLWVVLVAVLVVAPPGVLLSATGSLWPSPFSRALVPLVALGVIVFAVAYGILARTFTSLASIIGALAHGVALAAPLFVIYLLAAQFVASLSFVFAQS